MSEIDGLGGIIGIRGLGSERLAAASYAPRQNFQKLCFVPTERNREFLFYVFHTPAAKYLVPGTWYVFSRRLAHSHHVITDRSVRTVILQ